MLKEGNKHLDFDAVRAANRGLADAANAVATKHNAAIAEALETYTDRKVAQPLRERASFKIGNDQLVIELLHEGDLPENVPEFMGIIAASFPASFAREAGKPVDVVAEELAAADVHLGTRWASVSIPLREILSDLEKRGIPESSIVDKIAHV